MLRIFSLAGGLLATFNAEEVQGRTVKSLKTSLAKQIGVTRFRQKWLGGNDSELHDDAVVPCCDVQLVILDFVKSTRSERKSLISACKENRPDELVDLLRTPLNPDGMPEHWAFLDALHLAADYGYPQIVLLLLEAGFKDVADNCGSTALHFAAQNGHSAVIKLLLEAGSQKMDATRCPFQRTALHVAAERGHSDVVKFLLEAGANQEVADKTGKNALDLALDAGHHEVVNLLQPKVQPQKRQRLRC